MRIPFRRLRPEARKPARAHAGDEGYDLCSVEEVSLRPGGRALIRTGISVAIPEGYAGLVLPRSGLALRHVVAPGDAPGLVHSGYRGEVMVPLINHDNEEAFRVERGMRGAQLVLVRAEEISFFEVETLETGTDGRGEGGFGSSGS